MAAQDIKYIHSVDLAVLFLQAQPMPILLQPDSTFPIIGKDFFQCGPEIPRMILLFNVHEFMNQDVINDPQGCHDNSPTEG